LASGATEDTCLAWNKNPSIFQNQAILITINIVELKNLLVLFLHHLIPNICYIKADFTIHCTMRILFFERLGQLNSSPKGFFDRVIKYTFTPMWRRRDMNALITLGKIGALIDVLLQGVTQISGSIQSVGGPVAYLGSFDFSAATVTGLNNGSFNNSIFTGTSTFQGPTVFQQGVVFDVGFDVSFGTAVMGDQVWADGSTITLLGTTTFLGAGGILDFTAVTVLGLPPATSMFNGTLSGTTTINGILVVNATSTFTAAEVHNAAATFNGLSTLAGTTNVTGVTTLSGATTTISSPITNITGDTTLSGGTTTISSPITNITGDTTLSGTTTTVTGQFIVGEMIWNGLTVDVASTVVFNGVGTLDFMSVEVNVMQVNQSVLASVFPWALSQLGTFRLTRFGEKVTMIGFTAITAAISNDIMTFPAVVPPDFAPFAPTDCAIIVINNSTTTSAFARIYPNGDVDIRLVVGPGFTAAGTAGFTTFGISWNTL
jgi:hypothetical protein